MNLGWSFALVNASKERVAKACKRELEMVEGCIQVRKVGDVIS